MKQQIKDQLLEQLTLALKNCELAAENARLASIDDQSVAETQYDTLAIEASYLAEGHSRRVSELKLCIELISKLSINDDSSVIVKGSLVTLEQHEDIQYFVAPAAAGYQLKIADKNIIVITPQSPLGSFLLGKQVGDEVNITIGQNHIQDEISAIL